MVASEGIASAEKKSGRTAAEGAIGSYIHTGARVGVLIEINCETDFVARGDMFQELLRDVSMQVAACPNVEYVTTDDIPNEIREREKAIEMGRDDLDGKPEQMKEKIVEGRIGKRLKELALMEQPFIKDSSITVAELVKQTAGKIGENVKVRRFTRYTLGEGIEVEESDSPLKSPPCRLLADPGARHGPSSAYDPNEQLARLGRLCRLRSIAVYREQALYLQVLRDELGPAVRQALFSLMSETDPLRLNQLTDGQRIRFMRRSTI